MLMQLVKGGGHWFLSGRSRRSPGDDSLAADDSVGDDVCNLFDRLSASFLIAVSSACIYVWNRKCIS
jgi:hypothetical protein